MKTINIKENSPQTTHGTERMHPKGQSVSTDASLCTRSNESADIYIWQK